MTGAEGLEGIVLRYGGFYGPGTGIARGGDMLEMVVKGRFPVVGDGGGVWSLDPHRGRRGGDRRGDRARRGRASTTSPTTSPAPVREWLPALAEAVGGRRPRHMPGFVGRLLLGQAGYAMMTEHPRAPPTPRPSRELGWTPAYPTWRQGFAAL